MAPFEVAYASVHFTGHVQGVGFRYQTRQVAKEFDVSGMVRNLADGRVHLEAEGDRGEVDHFVREVEDRLGMYIRKTEKHAGIREARHSGFTIG